MLEALGHAVALSFATSQVSQEVANALSKLLPGLTHASVVVANPSGRRWALVGASDFACAGPTLLTLLDPQRSAAGLALRTGKLVQSSLLNGARDKSLRLGDVAAMAEAAPATKLMLCIPISPEEGKMQRGRQLQGALLFGLDKEQELSKRQLAALLLLARLLPQALARAAAPSGVMETVDFMTGAAPYVCPCCTSGGEDSEVEEDESGDPGSPCWDDDRNHGPSCPPPSQPLLVPAVGSTAGSLVDADRSMQRPCSACCAECSSSAAGGRPQPGSVGEGEGLVERSLPSCSSLTPPAAAAAAPAAAAAATIDDEPACSSCSCSQADLAKPHLAAGLDGGKCGGMLAQQPCELKTSPSEESLDELDSMWEGGGATGKGAAPAAPRRRASLQLDPESERRHWLSMTFVNPAVEREFIKWHSQHQIKIDMLFTLLLVAALGIVAFCHPFKLAERNPWGVVLGCFLVAPMSLALLGRQTYSANRERIVVVMRLLLVAFINLVSIPSYQGFIQQEKLLRRATFWMLTGAESLLITALGLQVRFHLQLPLQFVCMATAAWHIPSMCAVCYSSLPSMVCHARSMRLLVGAGVLLPSAALRLVEAKSRATFIEKMRAT